VVRGVKPRLGQLSSETTRAGRFTRQMAEPRLHAAHTAGATPITRRVRHCEIPRDR
jgi:hypothetical protein